MRGIERERERFTQPVQQSKPKLIKVCAKIEAELRSRKVLSVEFNKPK